MKEADFNGTNKFYYEYEVIVV